MNPIDLYFITGSREEFLSDLYALGLVTPYQVSYEACLGVAIDYIGELVETPAVLDYTQTPIAVTTAATLFPGYRASLRLTGPDAAAQAEAIAAADMEHTELLLPEDVPAQQMRWGGGSTPWTGAATVPPPPPGTDLVDAKARLLARLAQRRWEVETGGVVMEGVPIRTDRESTAMLSAAVTFCDLESEAVVRWKAADGQFYDLGEAGVRAIALDVGRHVQACFAREADLSVQIHDAETAEDLAALAVQVEGFTP